MRKKKQEERERAMAEELRAIVGDYEKRLAAEREKVGDLEGLAEIALDTLKRGNRIQLESEASSYFAGLGDEFDTFRLVKLEAIENVERVWHRYLRSQGRDPEALRAVDVEALANRHPELRGIAHRFGGES